MFRQLIGVLIAGSVGSSSYLRREQAAYLGPNEFPIIRGGQYPGPPVIETGVFNFKTPMLVQIRESDPTSGNISLPGLASPLNVTKDAVLGDWAYCTCKTDGTNGTLVYVDRQWPSNVKTTVADNAIAPTVSVPTLADISPVTQAPTTTTVAPETTTPTVIIPAAPFTDSPSVIAPATEAPSTEAPSSGATETEAASTEEPKTEAPSTEAPSTEAPSTEAPSTEAPVTESPSTEAPLTEAPSTEAPSTEAPSTEAPSTETPSTEAPSTEVPSTEAPSTEAPSTEASSTEAPSTEAPSTEAPSTEASSTEAPSTEAPSAETASSEASASSSADSAASASTSSGEANSETPAASLLQVSVGTRRVSIMRSDECECTNPWDSFHDPTDSALCSVTSGVNICLVRIKNTASQLSPSEARSQAVALLSQIDAEFIADNPVL